MQNLNQTVDQSKISRIPQISQKRTKKIEISRSSLNPNIKKTTRNPNTKSKLQKTTTKLFSTNMSCSKMYRDSFFSSPKRFSDTLYSGSLFGSGKTSPKVFGQKLSKNLKEIKSSPKWEDSKLPLTPTEVLSKFSDSLPLWEHEEIKDYPKVYFIGKPLKPRSAEFDDSEGDYKILIKDHIAFRYEIVRLLGRGSFGQVIEVFDHCSKKKLALKIIKNKRNYNEQAKVEVEMLETIKLYDKEKKSNIIEIINKFVFRNHMVNAI